VRQFASKKKKQKTAAELRPFVLEK
jgi:hypothetical protein